MTIRATLAASAAAITLALPLAGHADPRDEHRATLAAATLGGHEIAYLDVGAPSDPAVLLLHGIPTSSYLFREVAPLLAARGYRVVAPDMLGFGASARPEDAVAYSTEARADRMVALLDELGIEDAALVLHDVGGLTGWQIVADAPERLSAVVATNTMAGLAGVTPAPLVMGIMGGQTTPKDAFAQLASDPQAAREMARMWLDQGWWGEGTAPEADVAVYGADIAGAQAAYTAFFGQAVPAFMSGEAARNAALAAYDGPTGIIFGERDGYFDPDVVIPDLAARLGVDDADITRIPEAGHYLQAQEPAAYVDALATFLDRNLEN
ncbi:alpha/beta fold hydrolase [Jannaschia sp. KMU-145]|uniref:alpha/beta fold hydrolase n=1 Tax=Jannaschia halovivens TaxID=3388667 RepID=UPI00396B05F6